LPTTTNDNWEDVSQRIGNRVRQSHCNSAEDYAGRRGFYVSQVSSKKRRKVNRVSRTGSEENSRITRRETWSQIDFEESSINERKII
jgi:hypothetical protein